jgi:hypothetical protein
MDEFSEQASIGMLEMTSRPRKAGRTHYSNFLEAIRRLPPPPCKGCPFNRECATKELACEQFWQYVHSMENQPAAWVHATPPTRVPTKRIYDLLDAETARRPQLRPVKKKMSRKLSDDAVREIRDNPHGETVVEAGRRYGISHTTAHRIRIGRTYQWVR